MTYLWVAVIILATITEAGTSMSLVAIWFIPSGIVALILSFLDVAVWIQAAVFFLIAFLLLVSTRKWLLKLVKPKFTATNADSHIGQEAIVTEEINNIEATGQAKTAGQFWTARSSENCIISVGTLVKIDRIEGVKLIVTPLGSDQTNKTNK